ncbi:cilia- and flagella-associated protein 20-like [Apis dorsata]|uniref:cilia- and flagella-associated protein 20-like n=1 Tax=Apis dorsata TaxID=7462 RepID=UPI0003DF6E98|nr:cilia- and flagella-associated protein 20-like [Apis dorsata]XP_031364768.1 cilia- and flagella-associated protein 20-like [Apis dorsata]XP_031364769.1 cilia- and flagella-associated protein 20-like [Apis dorsata]
MFRNKYQHGLMSILYSCGSSPLELWDMHVKNGYIRRVTDDEVKSLALELAGTNVTTTYIYCPRGNRKASLGIKLPFLIMIIKNMKKYFTFEITILDDKDMHRRFRMSNFQSTTRVRPFCTSMPIGLSGGWNQIQFNLSDFTRRAYGTNYMETTRVQIHANCRIRRIYFADRLYSEDELPEDFKLFLPIHRKKCIRERDVKEIEKKEPPEEIEIEEPPPFEGVPEEEREEEEEPEELPEELVEEIPPEIERREIREVDEEEEEAIEPEFEAEEEVEEEIEAEIGPTAYVTEEETEAEEPGDEEEYAVP